MKLDVCHFIQFKDKYFCKKMATLSHTNIIVTDNAQMTYKITNCIWFICADIFDLTFYILDSHL